MPARSTKPATARRRAAAGSAAPPAAGEVERAVLGDLKRIGKADKDLAASGLAASAVALAREIDTAGNSATSKSMCARTLLDTLETLLKLAPAKEESTPLDDLQRRRAAKLGQTGT